jgi:hypothetical protein
MFTTEKMSELLKEFCENESLPFESADELLVSRNVKLTPQQRLFLERFCRLWDVAQQIEDDEADELNRIYANTCT